MKYVGLFLLLLYVGVALSYVVPHEWLRNTYESEQFKSARRTLARSGDAPYRHVNHRHRQTIKRDVCVAGAGASGLGFSYWATQLGQRGKTVIVLEPESFIGGNCNTVPFTAQGFSGAIDIGFAVFSNSSYLIDKGDTFWVTPSGQFRTDVFINELTGGKAFPIVQGPPQPSNNLVFKFSTGEPTSTPPFNATAFGIALNNLFGLLNKYPWMENSVRPGHIPADSELLLPFSDIIRNYGLEPLVPVFFDVVAPWPDYDDVTALYGIISLKKALLYIFTDSYAGFIVLGGCVQVYDAIEQTVGSENILTEVEYLRVKRPPASSNSNKPHELRVRVGKGSGRYEVNIECNKFVAAFPATSETIDFLKPDRREQDAFKDFQGRYWGSIAFDSKGPVPDQFLPFDLKNYDPDRPFGKPEVPYLAPFTRRVPLPGAPGVSYINAGNCEPTIQEAYQIFEDQTKNLPSSVVTNTTIRVLIPHKVYQPFLSPQVLSRDVNPYALIRRLNSELYRGMLWLNTNEGDNDHSIQHLNAKKAAEWFKLLEYI